MPCACCTHIIYLIYKCISVYFNLMIPPGTLAILPEGIWLTRHETKWVLEALDIAADAVQGGNRQALVEKAITLVTRKLWEELADILEMNGDQHD